ncbi:Galactosylgalactosylxylosylprotein 3-beta-glucuronosyltransferase 1 [Acipenser ruthenus]|uniref:Galactosylgalactosylxylosylprotein 3-beta-glucuronosyltransferase n=1 Tax=Acipenser ruthenus TaxID=7906 RepID=A0A444UWJ8_ACIRT|nr:Galactosylgalactosylxylosylprotein 3-beta-glucuronosyltransferase 1 [Acipenser ruthenus]
MRSTRKVSVWPVAFVGGLRYESPKVNAAGKVYGWKTVFDPHRPFAIDMAGFAVNLRLILFKPQAYFKLRGVKGGYQESSLLRELVTLNDLEPKAANCTKVMKRFSSSPGDAEEKRYPGHRVDSVTLDFTDHSLAPKRHCPAASNPKGMSSPSKRIVYHAREAWDDGSDARRDAGQGSDSKEYCSSDKDIVEVVRTEYVYTRPPPWSDVLPTIHVITPTYSRPVQKAELTRLANTFLHVTNLHWILVEDSQRRTALVTRLLHETGLNYTHLNVETPRNYKLRGDMRDPRIPRGTMQRNLALRWLRETCNANQSLPAIVYFANDDNTYSLEVCEEVGLQFQTG